MKAARKQRKQEKAQAKAARLENKKRRMEAFLDSVRPRLLRRNALLHVLAEKGLPRVQWQAYLIEQHDAVFRLGPSGVAPGHAMTVIFLAPHSVDIETADLVKIQEEAESQAQRSQKWAPMHHPSVKCDPGGHLSCCRLMACADSLQALADALRSPSEEDLALAELYTLTELDKIHP